MSLEYLAQAIGRMRSPSATETGKTFSVFEKPSCPFKVLGVPLIEDSGDGQAIGCLLPFTVVASQRDWWVAFGLRHNLVPGVSFTCV